MVIDHRVDGENEVHSDASRGLPSSNLGLFTQNLHFVSCDAKFDRTTQIERLPFWS
jgi:hypothetical protein